MEYKGGCVMKALRGIFLAAAMTLSLFVGSQDIACARGRVVVRVAPPAPKVVAVARPVCPYKQGVWMAGNWEWRHGKHVWIDGRWIKAKANHTWVDGHWMNMRDGWEWIPGHWRK
jgi:hypothetical protein